MAFGAIPSTVFNDPADVLLPEGWSFTRPAAGIYTTVQPNTGRWIYNKITGERRAAHMTGDVWEFVAASAQQPADVETKTEGVSLFDRLQNSISENPFAYLTSASIFVVILSSLSGSRK